MAPRLEAQPTAVEGSTPANTNLHSMTIRVVDAGTTNPVANAQISIPTYRPSSGEEQSKEDRWITDERGAVTLKVAAAAVNANYFTLVVNSTNYPPRIASWNSQSGPVRASLPSEHTFKLERGVTIGGYVQDERGKPLPGMIVVPWGNGAAAYSYNSGGRRRQGQEYSFLNRGDKSGVTTDAMGFWTYTNFPPDISVLQLEVVGPDGRRSQFATAGAARVTNAEDAQEVDFDALRATNAILVLRDGVTVRVVVVDEAGKPVNGVRFRERSERLWNVAAQQVTNNADGQFELPNRTAPQYLLSAEADGYAIASAIVTPAENAEVRIVLSPAQPRRLRVLNEQGDPVAGARVTSIERRNHGHVLNWGSMTDAEGRVVWTNAPRKEVTVAVRISNGQSRMVRLKADGAERILQLRKGVDSAIQLQARVVEVESGRPIERFEVWRGDRPLGNAFKVAGWFGTNGVFRGELAMDSQHAAAMYRLQFRAEGYAPWTSEDLFFDEGDFEATVQLRKATVPVGVVLQPDGQPAADAKVMLNGRQGSIFANGPDSYHPNVGVISKRSGGDGSFRFDTAEDDQRLVVTHRSGFASLTVEELRRIQKVPLRAWARMDGVLRTGGQPLARELIHIKAPLTWEASEGIQLLFTASTDADGRFTFTNLPPGDFVLYRTPHSIMNLSQTESHRLIVSLKAGETRHVDYGFGGRTVVGRIEASGEVDWLNDPHLLSVKLPPAPAGPSHWEFADPKEYETARKAHARSAAFLDYERKRQQFQLVFDRDGNFKADDVPPGKYELRLRATKPVKDPRMGRFQGNEEALGSLTREITVPAGKPGEEFDLGTLEMEVKEAPGVRLPPLEFTAETLDGRPFNLAGLRGKPVALIFWAKWAPYSPARLADLRNAFQALGANRGAAFVTVNLDESVEVARAGLAGLDAGWTHTRLAGAARVEVTEQLGVDTLPAILLLDAEGRVTVRDPGGSRIRPTIERLVKQTAKK